MTYKIRKIRPTKKPVPLPEALPGRGDKSWEIEEAPAGRAHCKYSEEGSSTLAVPLEDTPCEKCGKNHNAAARLHELAHAALSPDTKKLRTSFKAKGTTFDVSLEAIAIAEEMRADYQARRVASRRGISYDYTCTHDAKDYFLELAKNHDFKQLAIEALTNPQGVILLSGTLTALRNEWEETADTTQAKIIKHIEDLVYEILDYIKKVKTFAAENYQKNIRSWTRQLHIGYATDQVLNLLDDSISSFQYELSRLAGAQENAKEHKPDIDDLTSARAAFDRSKEEGRYFLNTLAYDGRSFSSALEMHGKLKAAQDEGLKGGQVSWAPMTIQKPPLTKKLPNHKLGWKPRATAEGTVPIYMYRHTIDGAIFKARRREQTGSVLIDVSGSMSLSREELEGIIEAAPAGIIALYSGDITSGILRIIGHKGKFVDIYEMAAKEGWTKEQVDASKHINFYAAGMGAGNDIDKPALEWLAKQPLPRIWVSDGQVVSPSHGWSKESWEDCEQVILANRINRVETPEEARLALTGKLELWR